MIKRLFVLIRDSKDKNFGHIFFIVFQTAVQSTVKDDWLQHEEHAVRYNFNKTKEKQKYNLALTLYICVCIYIHTYIYKFKPK